MMGTTPIGERQLENGSVAGPGAASTFIVTVHGIGPYASHGATHKLVEALGPALVAALNATPVDFNWYEIVEAERDGSEKVRQLAASILEAAHLSSEAQVGAAGYLVRGAGFLFEALFKLSLLSVPVCILLLISAVPLYVGLGAFGLAERGASLALHWIVVLWTLTADFLVTGLVLSALLRVIGLRLFAATLLRRLILVVLQPVVPVMYRLGDTNTRQWLRGLAYFAVFYGFVAGGIGWWSPDAAAQYSGLNFTNLSITAGALFTFYLVGLGISKVINVPVKLARDIFNYIGDARHRAIIQDGLRRNVEEQCGHGAEISRGAHLILVGHSLGSVIALDSLCNSSLWARFASISLVTCGSPIHRCFQRFFPGLYFPRDAAGCIGRIQSRSQTVRWLNVFRAGLLRGDPVGQALFSHGGSGTDLPVYQRARILMKAHLDYWDDPEVLKSVAGSWQRMLPQLQRREEQISPTPIRHPSIFDQLHNVALTALALSVFGGFVFAWTNAVAIIHDRKTVAQDYLARVVSTGVVSRATVTHSTTHWGYGEDISFPVQVYEFEFKDRDGVVRRLVFHEEENSGIEGGLYFDSAALRKALGRKEESKDKQTFEVPILYLEDDRDHLTLADQRLRPTASGFPTFELILTGIRGSFWLIIIVLGLSYLAARSVVQMILPPTSYRR
jgi:hypothetical protein